MVDKHKRILWRYIGERGSSHDLPIFHESKLGQYLLSIWNYLDEKGLYIIGDSTYAMRSYLLTPYNNARPGSSEDSFNLFISSSRIFVECAFGELDCRWGIFWKPLEGNLENHQYTIDSAFRLHNFIIEHRRQASGTDLDYRYDEVELLDEELDASCDEYLELNHFASNGVHTNDGSKNHHSRSQRPGRPSGDKAESRRQGVIRRDFIWDNLESMNLTRPRGEDCDDFVCKLKDKYNRPINNHFEEWSTWPSLSISSFYPFHTFKS